MFGVFITPRDDTLHEREYRTIAIPWTFNLIGKVDVKWFFAKRGSSAPKQEIFQIGVDGTQDTSNTPEQFTNRIEFKGDLSDTKERKDASLAIKDFTKRDEGVYTCRVSGIRTFEKAITVRVTGMCRVENLGLFHI